MKEISQCWFLLPFTSNVTDNVTSVIELLRTRPEAEVGLSCVRIYLRPNPTWESSWQISHVLLCIIAFPFSALRMKRSDVFHRTFIFHYFSWQAEHKNKCFLCEGVHVFLFQGLTSSAESCGGSGDLIKPWRKLLNWVGYLYITLWNWENRLSFRILPEVTNWSSLSISWSIACPPLPSVNMFCALIKFLRSADLKIILLWCVRKQQHSILIDFLNIFGQIFAFSESTFLPCIHQNCFDLHSAVILAD